MNPRRLSLQNFLCYRDRVGPISFEGFQLACLCGDNGAGKSALLDAITWALWGEARGRGDDDLVHAGEREMEVELDFDLNGQSYRVIRKHLKGIPPHPGRSLLELQLTTQEQSRSLSRPNLTETQRYLEKELLHMDYDTFINSAFLLQGRADEFTRKTPGQRKEVLAQVLGLSLYDDLETEAKALSEERKTMRKKIALSLEKMEAELALLPQYQKEKGEAETKLSKLEQELSAQETALKRLHQHLERLRLRQEQLSDIEKNLRLLEDKLTSGRQEIAQLEAQAQELAQALTQRQDIEVGYNRYLEVKRLEAELSSKGLKLRPLERRKVDLERAILNGQSQLEQEKAVLQHRLEGLRPLRDSLALWEKEMAQVLAELNRLEEEERSLQLLRGQGQELWGQLQRLEASREQVERQREELTPKRTMLLQGDARCPLCGAELGPDRRHDLEGEYESLAQGLAQALSSNEEEQRQGRKRYQDLLSLVQDKTGKLSQQRPLALARQGTLQGQIEQAQAAAQQIPHIEERLAQVEAVLAKQGWAGEQRQELVRIEEEIKALGYDPKEHQRAQGQVAQWQGYETKKARLEEAERRLPLAQNSLERARQSLHDQLNQSEQKRQEKEALSQELSHLPQLQRDLPLAEEQLRSLRGTKELEQRHLGAIEESLRRCAQLEQERQELKARQGLLAEEEGVYKELAEALGKGGVQALLIEQALPQLAQEADSLLKRLTDNRMSLDFRTQRLTRQGTAIETLDIIISDELGTRNYEMYSGGEAFRIDFALRVALARLVARRAGAPLSLLVIDEGFGTQDAAGREHLIQAINAVAQDFDKLIVVTHMEELKERFASRIEVTKTENGSQVEVFV